MSSSDPSTPFDKLRVTEGVMVSLPNQMVSREPAERSNHHDSEQRTKNRFLNCS